MLKKEVDASDEQRFLNKLLVSELKKQLAERESIQEKLERQRDEFKAACELAQQQGKLFTNATLLQLLESEVVKLEERDKAERFELNRQLYTQKLELEKLQRKNDKIYVLYQETLANKRALETKMEVMEYYREKITRLGKECIQKETELHGFILKMFDRLSKL
ncbi:unnamed protein product [Gongylonema pulchrum]|uniref:Basal body-orientation factor 1 n=1 Tax=Gongylonema pulchrum TaxID=637853 RepID=A0A183DQD5_9BILA|nr:unnamed protein product [Gongylonema pulchrum]